MLKWIKKSEYEFLLDIKKIMIERVTNGKKCS